MDTSFKCQIVDQTADTLTIMCKKAAEPVAKPEERQLGCGQDFVPGRKDRIGDQRCFTAADCKGVNVQCNSTFVADSCQGNVIKKCTAPPQVLPPDANAKPKPKKRFTTL